MAAEDPFHAHITAPQRTVLFNRFHGIDRTAGIESTGLRQKRRKYVPVSLDQDDQEPTRDLGEKA